MKKQNWILGLIISLGIALIAVFPRMFRSDNFDWDLVLNGFLSNFMFCYYSWLAHSYLSKRSSRFRETRSRALYASACIILVASTIYLFDLLVPGTTNKLLRYVNAQPTQKWAILTVRGVIISGFFYFIIYYLKLLGQKQQAVLEIQELKQSKLEASLASLREQLSPHFLFNTLNTLSSLTNDKTVKEYVNELANIYRYVLQFRDTNTVPLKQELEFIASYLYIIKTRLEDAVIADIRIPGHLLSSRIPPLTLQILIENAIKHNAATSSKPLRISISTSEDREILISNNRQAKKSVLPSTGIGLQNIARRYSLLFGKDIRISETAESFTIKLPIIP